MKRFLYILIVFAILTGCREFKDTNGNLDSIPDSVKKSIEAGNVPLKSETITPSEDGGQ